MPISIPSANPYDAEGIREDLVILLLSANFVKCNSRQHFGVYVYVLTVIKIFPEHWAR